MVLTDKSLRSYKVGYIVEENLIAKKYVEILQEYESTLAPFTSETLLYDNAAIPNLTL